MNTTFNVSNEKKGTWYAIVSGLLYGLLGFFGINLMNEGMSIACVSFWRFFISFLFLVIIILSQKRVNLSNHKELFKGFVIGAIFYSAPSMLFFLACKYISSGQSMVIFFIYPVFVMILNWIFEKQAIKPHYFLSFVIILLGLILLLDLNEIDFDVIGIGASILSAISYSFYIFLSKRIKLTPVYSTTMVSLGCAVTSGVLALAENSLSIPNTDITWLYSIGLGLFCSAIPILLMLGAMKYISSDKASLLSVLEPVFSVIFGVFLLNEAIKANTIIGVVLTLFGVMTITMNKKSFAFFRQAAR